MEPVPRAQHRLIGVEVNAGITVQTVLFRRRFSFKLKNANWEHCAYQLDAAVENIPATAECYDQFVYALRKVARKNIPVDREGTTSQAWHPSPPNWSKNTERNKKTIPSQIAPSHSVRNWWAPSQRNAVKHGRPWSNQQTWPSAVKRRGPR